MSIDKEFAHLSSIKNDGEKARNSVNKGRNKPSKTMNFIRNSTLKLLIPALLMPGVGVNNTLRNRGINNSSNKDKKTEIINNENNTLITIDSDELSVSDLAAFKPNTISYKPSLIENELHDSKLIFDSGKYDENNISSISIDEELGFAPGTHIPQTVSEEIYLNIFRRLSYEDYQYMFKGLKDLRQGTLGDCYLVAAMKNIARSKYFDVLMMTSLERTGEDSFNLYMPLGEPKGVKVKITSKDLESASIHGSIGYKILEVGFAKYLLFGKGIIDNMDITMTDTLMNKIKGGFTGDAMLTFLGPKSFSTVSLTDNAKYRLTVLNYLYSFDPKNLRSISVTSKKKEGKNDKKFYIIGGQIIYYGHAYNICSVEKNGDVIEYVTLENTWNTDKKKGGKKVTLGISDFLDCFNSVNAGETTCNFLNHITSPDEINVVDIIDRNNS